MIRALSTACAVLALGLFVADTADARGRGGGKRGHGYSHSHGGGGSWSRGGRCSYCGCRGGPGYRGPDGNCVGKRNITKVCGSPPSSRCKYEGKGARNETPSPTHHPKVTNPFG